VAEVSALPLRANVTVDADQRTQVLAFDNESAGVNHVFALTGMAGQSVRVMVLDGNGNQLTAYTVASGTSFSLRLDSPGRHYLLAHAHVGNTEAVALGVSVQVLRDTHRALELGMGQRGQIGSSAASDYWHFSLEQASTLVFQGTSDQSLSWVLSEAQGGSLFSGSMGARVLSLAAGDYSLRVHGWPSGVSQYALAVSSLADATVLDAGQVVAAEIAAGQAGAVFMLPVAAGEAWYLGAQSAQPGSRVAVFNAQGSQILNSVIGGAALQLPVAARSGHYTVVVSADAPEQASAFSLQAHRRTETVGAAVLGEAIAGELAGGHEFHSFRLTLDAPGRLVMADGGSAESIRWRLVPAGQTSGGTGWLSGTQAPTVAAGDYVLTLSTNAASAAAYRFELLDTRGGVSLGTAPLEAVFSAGRSAQAYLIDDVRELRRIISLSAAEPAELTWTLFQSSWSGWSWLADGQGGESTQTPQLGQGGRYLLVVTRNGESAQPLPYSVAMTPLVAAPLSMGAVQTPTFAPAQFQHDYAFSLEAPTAVLFDALAGQTSLQWRLTDSQGGWVANGTFDESTSWTQRRFDLAGGDYRLSVFRSSASTELAYAFRVAPFSAAPAVLENGQGTLSGTLDPGAGAVAYRLDVAAGERLSVNLNSLSAGNLRWRLLSSNGGQLANGAGVGSGLADLRLVEAGSYFLLLDGYLTNTEALDYELVVSLAAPRDNRPEGPEILPGDAPIVVELPRWQSAAYRFTLAEAGWVTLGGTFEAGAYLSWELRDLEWGLYSGGLSSSNSAAEAVWLDAGDYALVFSNPGWYGDESARVSFRLEREAQFARAELGQVIEGYGPYLMALEAGQTVYFRSPGAAEWQVRSPQGGWAAWVPAGGQEFVAYRAEVSGDYLVGVSYFDTQETEAPRFESRVQTERVREIALDELVSVVVDETNVEHLDFVLSGPGVFMLDASFMTAEQVWWSLSRDGQIVSDGFWLGDVSVSAGGYFGVWYEQGDPVLALEAGSYRLSVYKQHDAYGDLRQSGEFSLRIGGLEQSASLSPDVVNSVEMLTGTSAVWRIDVDGTKSLLLADWSFTERAMLRLFDAQGALLHDDAWWDGHEVLTLPQAGTYFLVLDTGNRPAEDPVTLAFTPLLVAPTVLALPGVNTRVDLTVPMDGRVTYQFDLAEAGLFQMEANGGLLDGWTLFDELGQAVPSNNGLLSLAAGHYSLVVTSAAAPGSTAYFRLVDVAQAAVAVDPSGASSVDLGAGDTAFVRVEVAEGQVLNLAWVASAGAQGQSRVVNALGETLYWLDSIFDGGAASLQIDESGVVYWVIERYDDGAPGLVTLELDVDLLTPPAIAQIALGETHAHTLGGLGTRSYVFDVAEGGLLWLDLLEGFEGEWVLRSANGGWVNSGYAGTGQGALLTIGAPGRYTLQLSAYGSTAEERDAAYRFRISDLLAAAVQLPGGQAVDVPFSADTRALAYRFDGAFNSAMLFEVLEGFPASWYLFDGALSVRSSGRTYDGLVQALSLGALGTHTLVVAADALPLAGEALRFRLADLRATAQPVPANTAVEGVLGSGQTLAVYSFTSIHMDGFRFLASGAEAGTLGWRLLGPSLAQVASGDVAFDGDGLSLNHGSGRYYLLIDRLGADAAQAIDYAFTVSRNEIAVGETREGSASTTGVSYRMVVSEPGWYLFDAFKGSSGGTADSYLYWTLTGANGQVFSDRPYLSGNRDRLQFLDAGEYSLRFHSSTSSYTGSYQFRILDAAAAEALELGAPTNAALVPGNASRIYRVSGALGEELGFVSQGSASGRWYLVDSTGQQLFSTALGSSTAGVRLPADGDYWLVIEGAATAFADQSFPFVVNRAVAQGALALNELVGGSLAAYQSISYRLDLDQASLLMFDSLGADAQVRWRLQGPGGQVFDSALAGDSLDTVRVLERGTYTLTLSNATAIDRSFAMRVLDRAGATPITPGAPLSVELSPRNGAVLYTFDAQQGERYYFDVVQSLLVAAEAQGKTFPVWALYDPQGAVVFGAAEMGYWWSGWSGYTPEGYDREPAAFASSGTYTLVLQGYNSATSAARVSFNVVPVPVHPPQVLDTLVVRPAPDLTVNEVVLAPATDLYTGQAVEVRWTVENRGVLATDTHWNDRIVVRNLDTGALVASLTVPYASTLEGDLGAGESRQRSAVVVLPEGASAAGRLSFTVMTDADNRIREGNASGNGESNNALSTTVQVALAAYADLRVEALRLSPDSAFQPGQTVDVGWTTINAGNKAVDAAWSERVEVRNRSTNELVAVVAIRDDLTAGALEAGQSRLRAAQFTWPAGFAAAGEFVIRVVADSAEEIVEANASGTGETNNSAQLVRMVGPDMQVRNLRVLSGAVQSGGEVSIAWEDWNLGASAAATGFHDRIVVRNVATNQVLVDTSLYYDPLRVVDGAQLGLVEAGQMRERALTFRLPPGLASVGQIRITVTTDQNSAGLGVLYETNLSNDAELNNSAQVVTTSVAVPYADLRVDSVSVPVSGVGGEYVLVSWTVSNRGEAPAEGEWTDRVVFSNNATIGDSDDVVVGSLRFSGTLQPGEHYTQTALVRLPMRGEGRYYLAVRADA
ncbi:MAG TPA: hypothetical protein DCY18_03290, partial [Thauera sp.]|nr:hypothetical protein [Thauera sp.]